MTIAWIILFGCLSLLVLIEGIFIIAILRVLGGVQLQVRGLEPTQEMRSLDHDRLAKHPLMTMDGQAISLPMLWAREPILFVFVSTSCSACVDMLQHIFELSMRTTTHSIPSHVLCLGQRAEVGKLMASVNLPSSISATVVEEPRLFQECGVSTLPTLLLVDTTGRVLVSEIGPISADRLQRVFAVNSTPAFVS
jgi:thioredoxin-related protein